MAPFPTPPAMPTSAFLASPGPFTSQPMTATFIGVGSARKRSSATFASGMRSICGDHHGHLERFDGDDDVVEVEVLEDLDLAEREIDHPLRLVADVARLPVADRTVVDADADRRSLLLRFLHDLAHAVFVVDVP